MIASHGNKRMAKSEFLRKLLISINVKKPSSLKLFVPATRPTSHNKNSKIQKGAITLAARRHNVNVLLSNIMFLIFILAILVVWCRPCRRFKWFQSERFLH